jgi:hypothetical protein
MLITLPNALACISDESNLFATIDKPIDIANFSATLQGIGYQPVLEQYNGVSQLTFTYETLIGKAITLEGEKQEVNVTITVYSSLNKPTTFEIYGVGSLDEKLRTAIKMASAANSIDLTDEEVNAISITSSSMTCFPTELEIYSCNTYGLIGKDSSHCEWVKNQSYELRCPMLQKEISEETDEVLKGMYQEEYNNSCLGKSANELVNNYFTMCLECFGPFSLESVISVVENPIQKIQTALKGEVKVKEKSNETKNMTYGQCVMAEAKIKNQCYASSAKDKSLKAQCKTAFKVAKEECKKIKHNFLETVIYSFY